MAVATVSPAVNAEPTPSAPTVDEVVIKSASESFSSTLTLKFDKPISSAEAAKVRSSLTQDQPMVTMASGTPLYCGSKWSSGDANGYWNIGYQCLAGNKRTIPWGFNLSIGIQNTVVGLVTEDGLTWFRNLGYAGKNTGHVEVPDYVFHGNLNPVAAGDDIDYQDLFTYRHNVGTGGTARLAVAGSVVLMN
jgi:hypothetical protein